MNEEIRNYEEMNLGMDSVSEETAGETPALTLEDFLATHQVGADVTAEVVVSERLKDFRFEIELFDKKQHENYLNASLVRNRSGKVVKQNTKLYNELIVINHCRYPNFRSLDFLKKIGVSTSKEALYKVLKIGEIDILAGKIMEFNGYDEEYSKLYDDAKN